MAVTVETLRNSHIGLRAASPVYRLWKDKWTDFWAEQNYAAVFLLRSRTCLQYFVFYEKSKIFLEVCKWPHYGHPSGWYGQRVLEKFPVNSALYHAHSRCFIASIYCSDILQVYIADIYCRYILQVCEWWAVKQDKVQILISLYRLKK
jgi:hypothetical protein